MTMLRSCYRSQMRLYRDRPDVLTWGRWHFCKPGAGVVPYFHLFGSSNWDWEHPFDPPLGEVGSGAHPYFNGAPVPRVKGTNTCGTRQQWETGSLFADRGTMAIAPDGVPLCCLAEPFTGGGDADGGTALQGRGPSFHAEGGDSDDGQVEQWGDGWQEASGGDSDDGQVEQWGDGWQQAGGGDSDDGQVEQWGDGWQQSGGGDSDDGAAEQRHGGYIAAGGGDSDDGSAEERFPGYQVAGGGDSDDGAAVQEAGGGGQDFGGCSNVPLTLFVDLTASGGCSALDGVSIQVDWDAGASAYLGSAAYGGGTVNAKVYEAGVGANLAIACNEAPGVGSPLTITCGPFHGTASLLASASCCTGFFAGDVHE